MSRKEKQTGATVDMDFSALERELAQMADETPDVPADFHEKWTKAIREESTATSESQETTAAKSGFRKQRRYILSAAAAFVLLIGGVLLAQNQTGNLLNRTKDGSEQTAGEQTAAADNEKEEAAVPAVADVADDEAAEEEYKADGEEPVDDLIMDDYDAAWDGADTAGESDWAAMGKANRSEDASAASEEIPQGEMLMMAMEEAMEEDVGSSPEPAKTPAPATAEPEEPTVTPKAEEKEKKPQKTPKGQTVETEENTSFLQRLWTFLLRATPWILGIAVVILFLVTNYIRNSKKKP